MHNQWRIAGNKSQDKKDSDNEDEVAATATTKDGGKKKPYVTPHKEKTCIHCKKKGHVENKCWPTYFKVYWKPSKLATLQLELGKQFFHDCTFRKVSFCS
jgi:hypothetical protein